MVGGALIILGIVMVLCLWIIFAPLHLVLDTGSQRYQVVQPLTFSFAFRPQHQPKLLLKIFGINIPLKPGPKTASEKPAKPVSTKPALKRSAGAWRFLITRSLRSIEIRHLELDIDTGDVITNAQLVPVAFFLSRGTPRLRTNFEGRVYCHIALVVHLNRLIWIFLRFLTKK